MSERTPAPHATAGRTGDTRITAGDCLHPANLPLWLGLAILRLLVRLPFAAQMRIGRALGRLIELLARERRRIATTNLALCFADLDERTRAAMRREHFEALGMSVLETGITWWRPRSWFAARCRIEGREHVDRALAGGRGILMLTPHYTALDIAGLGATAYVPMHANFDPPRNALFSKLLQRGRLRHVESLVDHQDLRGILRTLRANGIMFFAPDQTVRRNRAGVVAPFFGIPVMTSTGTSRLARISKAPVMTMLLLREADQSGYVIRFLPPLADFPSADVEADTARINAHMEQCIRDHAPAQYLWVHQRFKRGDKEAHTDPYRDTQAGRARKLPPPAYRWMSRLLAPLVGAYTLRRAWRDGGMDYLAQRYACRLAPVPARPLWLHCASVGEVVTAMPLLHALAEGETHGLLLTTGTPTGMAVARRQVPAGTVLAYLPVDRPGPVGRFLAHARPRAALVLETELWPWLFNELRNTGTPLLIVNGRLSARTLHARAGWLQEAARFCLRRARRILARSETDAAGFQQLGANARRIEVIGNLKFAAVDTTAASPVELGRPYVLAASTHADEELQLVRAWLARRPDTHMLVIAPRHAERGPGLLRELAATGCSIRRRAAGEAVAADTDVYLADTLGELPALMAGADAVFMGGSLVPHGGQNVLEPARLGRAIVTGPHTDNFRDETARLEAADALLRGDDADAIAQLLCRLLAEPDTAAAMGRRAREVVDREAGVARRYVDAIRAELAD